MKNIFWSVLCLNLVAVSVLFAGEQELLEQIAELKVQKTDVSISLHKITEKYRENSKSLAGFKVEMRKGKKLSNRYDKTEADEETSQLIDKCRAAENEFSELRKKLDDHLSKTEAGIARKKAFDEAVKNSASEKESLLDTIGQRAKILKEQKRITDELELAEKKLEELQASEMK